MLYSPKIITKLWLFWSMSDMIFNHRFSNALLES